MKAMKIVFAFTRLRNSSVVNSHSSGRSLSLRVALSFALFALPQLCDSALHRLPIVIACMRARYHNNSLSLTRKMAGRRLLDSPFEAKRERSRARPDESCDMHAEATSVFSSNGGGEVIGV